MDNIPLTISSPSDESIHQYSDEIPPSISMIGSTTYSPTTGLYFKWFSSAQKREDVSGYFDAHLNEAVGTSYAQADNWSWNNARPGSQYIQFIAKDQLVISDGDMESKLSAITKLGSQGGKFPSGDLIKRRIHVVGSLAYLWESAGSTVISMREQIGDTYDFNIGGGFSKDFYIGMEVRVDTFDDEETGVTWGTDNDDLLSYELEQKITIGGTYATIFKSGVDHSPDDTATYLYKETVHDSSLKVALISIPITQVKDGNIYYYLLTVNKGATSIQYEFTITVTT